MRVHQGPCRPEGKNEFPNRARPAPTEQTAQAHRISAMPDHAGTILSYDRIGIPFPDRIPGALMWGRAADSRPSTAPGGRSTTSHKTARRNLVSGDGMLLLPGKRRSPVRVRWFDPASIRSERCSWPSRWIDSSSSRVCRCGARPRPRRRGSTIHTVSPVSARSSRSRSRRGGGRRPPGGRHRVVHLSRDDRRDSRPTLTRLHQHLVGKPASTTRSSRGPHTPRTSLCRHGPLRARDRPGTAEQLAASPAATRWTAHGAAGAGGARPS
jgi:hypothetical protein